MIWYEIKGRKSQLSTLIFILLNIYLYKALRLPLQTSPEFKKTYRYIRGNFSLQLQYFSCFSQLQSKRGKLIIIAMIQLHSHNLREKIQVFFLLPVAVYFLAHFIPYFTVKHRDCIVVVPNCDCDMLVDDYDDLRIERTRLIKGVMQ